MRNRRLITTITAAILVLVFSSAPAKACTIFMAEQGELVLAGNNEDWMYSCPTYMTVAAPDDDSYGRVCFYNSTYVQGGMNEHGLFYDGASCPVSEVPRDDGKEQLGMDLGDVVLSRCANVQEVVDLLENCNVPNGFADHLLFADASGDSVVIEWMEGEMHVIDKEDTGYQLVTNFWLTNTALGGYPCSRYRTAEELLKENVLSLNLFAGILDATKQNWGSGGTLYSHIYDLSNQIVYVFYRGSMDNAYKINLLNRLEAMERGEVETLNISDLTFSTSMAEEDSLQATDFDGTVTVPKEPETAESEDSNTAIASGKLSATKLPKTGEEVSDERIQKHFPYLWLVWLVVFIAAIIGILARVVVFRKIYSKTKKDN